MEAILGKDRHMQCVGKSEEFVESIYIATKKAVLAGNLSSEGLDSLIDLLTELSNRVKEGEFSGEQEG